MRLQITILVIGLAFDIFIAGLIYKQKTSNIEFQPKVLAYQDNIESTTPTATPSLSPSPKPTSSPFPSPNTVVELKNEGVPTESAEPTANPIPTSPATPLPTITSTPQPLTPIPQPTVRPDIVAPAHLEPVFDRYAAEYGVDKNLLKSVAKCESGFNPGAVNGPYAGMYQYSESRWIENRQIMGLDPNPDLRFNAKEAIKTAAFFMVRGGISMWPNCH